MEFTLIQVGSIATRRKFINLPAFIYQNEPKWIRPLDKDVESVFNPKKNKHFRNGEVVRWILVDNTGRTVGRVAAFVNYPAAKTQEQPTGGTGFFECINNTEAATCLFDACKEWLKSKGMEAMDGPINFGERDRWWGLLVDGFYEPNYCVNFNPPYYINLFESYGFKIYFRQFTYHMPVSAEHVDPIIWEKAQRITQNPEYTFRTISKDNLPKFAEDFATIFNSGWGKFVGVSKISKAQAMSLMKSIKPVIDERLILFGYYQDQPIAMQIMIPEINQVVKHLNGSLNLLRKLQFLYLLKVKKVCTKALGLIFGIVPQHQGKGVEGAMIKSFANLALRSDFPYQEIELNWIGDFNPAMCKVLEQIGAKVRKTHITFRYMFDPNKEVRPPKRVS